MSEKAITKETIKKIANKKIILGVAAILIALAVICVTSFIPFIITGEKLATEKFWTDELIIVAIIIFAMVSVMYIGQAGNAQNPASEIAKARAEFKTEKEKVKNTNFFSQWIKKVKQPRDIQYIKERELRKVGVYDYTVLLLEDRQIKELANDAQRYDVPNGEKGRYYSQLKENQVKTILELKDGIRKVHLVEPGYYLTVSSIESDKTDSEKSGREQKVKTAKMAFAVISRIVITLIPALIFGALARDLASSGLDVADAFATFLSRLMALASSAFAGYYLGCELNDTDADYIILRVNVIKEYLEDNDFKPLTVQELAKQDYIERVKRENEEYSKAIAFNGTLQE